MGYWKMKYYIMLVYTLSNDVIPSTKNSFNFFTRRSNMSAKQRYLSMQMIANFPIIGFSGIVG